MSKQSYMGLEERRGYQWPASALTGHEMAILADCREKTGLSICELVKQAVIEMDKIIINSNTT